MHVRSLRPQLLHRAFLLPVIPGLLLIVLLFASLNGTATYAKGAVPSSGNAPHFSKQVRLGFPSGDDWEPSVAADRYGHIYALYKHYDVSGGQTCAGCDLHLLFQRSDDGGNTWSAPRPIAPGPVKGGQYDPQIMVDPIDGRTIWASFLQYTNSLIAVVKSTDFGQTWSSIQIVTNRPPGLDKDELAVRGKTVLVAYDDNFNTWASISTDGGNTWSTREVFPTSKQFSLSLSAGAAIDSQGNFFISWDSYDQAHRKAGQGPVTLWVSRSSDGGQTWTRTIIGVSVGAAPACNPCGFDYLSSQMALRIGSDDTIYVLWNTNVDGINNTPERIYFARSTNHGQSYSLPVDISNAPFGVEHCFPAIAVGSQSGDVRIGWMDTRTGAWNVFYRQSADRGAHFSAVTQISTYVPGYPYLTPKGFALPYGDYFSMVVDSSGQTQAVWGEGPSYQGPGNQWASHTLDD